MSVLSVANVHLNVSGTSRIENIGDGAIRFKAPAVQIPSANSTTRPASPQDGFFYYDTEIEKFQAYTNGQWVALLVGINVDFGIIYDVANNAHIVANISFDAANSSFDAANAAFLNSNVSFDAANAAFLNSNVSFDAANAAFLNSNVSFDAANAAFLNSNVSFDAANSAFGTANIKTTTAKSIALAMILGG